MPIHKKLHYYQVIDSLLRHSNSNNIPLAGRNVNYLQVRPPTENAERQINFSEILFEIALETARQIHKN